VNLTKTEFLKMFLLLLAHLFPSVLNHCFKEFDSKIIIHSRRFGFKRKNPFLRSPLRTPYSSRSYSNHYRHSLRYWRQV